MLPGFPGWSWRIPFILGGAFGILGYFLRRSIEETPVFDNIMHQRTSHTLFKNERFFPLLVAFKNHKKYALCHDARGKMA